MLWAFFYFAGRLHSSFCLLSTASFGHADNRAIARTSLVASTPDVAHFLHGSFVPLSFYLLFGISMLPKRYEELTSLHAMLPCSFARRNCLNVRTVRQRGNACMGGGGQRSKGPFRFLFFGGMASSFPPSSVGFQLILIVCRRRTICRASISGQKDVGRRPSSSSPGVCRLQGSQGVQLRLRVDRSQWHRCEDVIEYKAN